MTKFFFEYVSLYYNMHKKYKKILKNNHTENTSISASSRFLYLKKILKNTETGFQHGLIMVEN